MFNSHNFLSSSIVKVKKVSETHIFDGPTWKKQSHEKRTNDQTEEKKKLRWNLRRPHSRKTTGDGEQTQQ